MVIFSSFNPAVIRNALHEGVEMIVIGYRRGMIVFRTSNYYVSTHLFPSNPPFPGHSDPKTQEDPDQGDNYRHDGPRV